MPGFRYLFGYLKLEITQKRKNKLLELLKVNLTSQNFRRSSIQNSQPATERMLNIAPSVISNSNGEKADSQADYDVYVDINELENKPSPLEGQSINSTIYESFEDLYEGRFQNLKNVGKRNENVVETVGKNFRLVNQMKQK